MLLTEKLRASFDRDGDLILVYESPHTKQLIVVPKRAFPMLEKLIKSAQVAQQCRAESLSNPPPSSSEQSQSSSEQKR